MCVLSAVLDYGMDKPDSYWDQKRVQEFIDLTEQAKDFDEKNDEPDCELDYKMQWLKDLEERVRKLEAQLGGE